MKDFLKWLPGAVWELVCQLPMRLFGCLWALAGLTLSGLILATVIFTVPESVWMVMTVAIGVLVWIGIEWSRRLPLGAGGGALLPVLVPAGIYGLTPLWLWIWVLGFGGELAVGPMIRSVAVLVASLLTVFWTSLASLTVLRYGPRGIFLLRVRWQASHWHPPSGWTQATRPTVKSEGD